jgi:hypothetical protein
MNQPNRRDDSKPNLDHETARDHPDHDQLDGSRERAEVDPTRDSLTKKQAGEIKLTDDEIDEIDDGGPLCI